MKVIALITVSVENIRIALSCGHDTAVLDIYMLWSVQNIECQVSDILCP
jgi:hypothetical protein